MRLPIKVVPGSSRDCIAGWLAGTLKIRVKANAEKGQANRAVEGVIAGALGLSRQNIRIVSGGGSARKLVEIDGLEEHEVREKLSAASP
jgi:uncharacterized protein YggU (UPF0235/DUF167 family)